MNELGKNSIKYILDLLKQIEKYIFKFVILCGEFFEKSIKKLNNPKMNFFILTIKIRIMKFLNKNVHNNDIILIKCSNSTEINKLAKDLLKKRIIRFD